MIIVYALYPFMFAVQQKSQKNAVVLSAVVSLIAVTVSFTCDLPDYNLRAISRIPLFMLGYICSPLINEERKIPVWPVLTSAIVFVGLELLRMRCMPENYGMRSLTFIPLTIVLMVLISFIAELLARLRVVHWLYRLIDFFGMISLEMYLLFSTVRDLLKRCTGAELQTMTDVAKLDISAFLVAALLGYLLTIFIKRLTDSFCSIHIPEETNT